MLHSGVNRLGLKIYVLTSGLYNAFILHCSSEYCFRIVMERWSSLWRKHVPTKANLRPKFYRRHFVLGLFVASVPRP